jgi:cytochrome c3-like protein
MTRRAGLMVALTALILAGMACTLGGAAAAQQAPAGCLACHARLADTLPANHPAPGSEDIRSCLACHTHGGQTMPLGWALHLHHYARPAFGGSCASCHVIDEAGILRLIGVEERGWTRATRDTVERMGAYFRSWAGSAHLDHRHAGQRVTCVGCHGSSLPKEPVALENCLRCHGSYERLAGLTGNAAPNPHKSHLGEPPCTFCHHVHTDAAFYCNRCHTFELNIPAKR